MQKSVVEYSSSWKLNVNYDSKMSGGLMEIVIGNAIVFIYISDIWCPSPDEKKSENFKVFPKTFLTY